MDRHERSTLATPGNRTRPNTAPRLSDAEAEDSLTLSAKAQALGINTRLIAPTNPSLPDLPWARTARRVHPLFVEYLYQKRQKALTDSPKIE